MISLSLLNILLQMLLAFISLFFLKKNKSPFVLMLSIFLLLTSLVETYCFILMKNGKPTFIFHHLYFFIEISLIYLMYKRLIDNEKWLFFSKNLLAITYVIWGVVFLKREFFFKMVIIGYINTAILLFLYLRELLLSDKILNYKKYLPFWLSVGFLVFYLPSIPFFSLLSYMKNRRLFFILDILIILKSIFIIYGLLCSNKKEKY